MKKKQRAFSKRALRVRISMIARERGLSDAEIAKAMNCGTAPARWWRSPRSTTSVLTG